MRSSEKDGEYVRAYTGLLNQQQQQAKIQADRERNIARQQKTQDEKMKAFIQEIKDQEELEAKRKKARDEHRRKKRERDRRERQNPTNIFQQTSNKKRRRRGKSRRR